jgi:DNA-directed RNA polymerase specialized sigma24 family protein
MLGSALADKRHAVIALNEQPAEGAFSVDAEVDRVYRETRGPVCAYLLYLGVPHDRAQEVTQEAFLRLYPNAAQGDGD